MLYFLFSISIGILLFMFGYYIGNQIGRMEPVREHLRSRRESKEQRIVLN
jgi:hypothetical protein